jgi:glycosyltransferase involved in cell wall biosynthesis
VPVLYIGNYGDISSGWAIAAQNNIRALSKVTEVVPRRIKYAPQDVPSDLLLMEEKDVRCDVCIQHVLPPNLVYNSSFYNIAYFVCESSSLGLTGWAQYLNLMDEVWVPSEFCREVCIKSGVTPKIRVVPHCLDVEQIFKTPGFDLKEQTEEEFLFYTVADFTKRKNLIATLRAFHTEFNGEAGLVIKTNNEEETRKIAEEVRKGLKKPCKAEIIIGGFIPKEQVYAIHKSCDVFVNSSYGEAFSIPTLEALAAGKTPICTGWSAFPELVSPDEGWLVKGRLEPCFAATTLPELQTSEEMWMSIDIVDLQRCMREAYEQSRQTKSFNCQKKSLNYSLDNVGKLMGEYLNV